MKLISKKAICSLEIGDTVYVNLPFNAEIIKVTKYGYALRTPDGTEWQYYDDREVRLIKRARRKKQ